jgi:hypothetical protein
MEDASAIALIHRCDPNTIRNGGDGNTVRVTPRINRNCLLVTATAAVEAGTMDIL